MQVEKLIKTGTKVFRQGRCVSYQMVEIALAIFFR